jgi:uncharacterized protein (DUF302 family)
MQVLTTTLAVDDVVAALQGAIEDQGMRLVTHINGQANAARIGREVPADQILEVFRPDFAIRVWSACKAAGIDIPLRIHVYEQADKVFVAYRTPSEVFESFGSPELMEVAADLDPIFAAIVSAVEGEAKATGAVA